jgi:CRISPR-associated exonuclease Cas4
MTGTQLVLLAGLLITLLGIAWAWRRAVALTKKSGVPAAKVVYSDMGPSEPGPPLRSERHGLAGRPDYIVRRGRTMIPVEVKPGRRAPEPYESDVLQLAAYCLLVSEAAGRRAPYGLLRYRDTTFRIPYTRQLEQRLLDTLDNIRTEMPAAPDRSHDDPVRCRRCGLCDQCGQALRD